MAKKRSAPPKASKKYQIELTPLSVFLWGGCLLFVLAWIFVLGILVGRGFLPGAVTALSDIKDEINVLQKMVRRDKPEELDASKGSDSDPQLAFYEKLEGKKDEANKKRVTKRRAEISHRKKASLANSKSSGANTLPSSTEMKYTVQLASLEDRGGVEKMIKDLAERGHSAYFSEARVKGKTYYRIRCGKFPTRKAAEEYAQKLEKEAGIKGFVSRIE